MEFRKKIVLLQYVQPKSCVIMDNVPLNQIKEIHAERMMYNKELAELLGNNPATISICVTNTSQPSLDNLIEIARRLKCKINGFVRTRSRFLWLMMVRRNPNIKYMFGLRMIRHERYSQYRWA